MRLISFDGFDFEANDYHGGLPWDTARGQTTARPGILPRTGTSPILTTGDISERNILIEIGYTGEDTLEIAFNRLLGRLDPFNNRERLLVAQLNNDTYVERPARVTLPSGMPSDGSVNYLAVLFVSSQPEWREQADTTPVPATFTISTNGDDILGQGFALENSGHSVAYPQFDIAWTAQPAVKDGDRGWQYRKTITVTNSTARDWHRVIVAANLGDTSALVTGGKAQSGDGDDALLYLNGVRQRRHLLNWNTPYTHMLFVVDRLAAGDALDYEHIYGNASAATDNSQVDLDRFESQYPVDSYIAVDVGETSGTATAGSTSTLTDSGATWDTNRWRGGYIKIVSGTGAADDQIRQVLSNTATVITVTRNFSVTPNATSGYVIWMSGFAIVGWDASAATSTTITDSSASWGVNEWVGATVTITFGTGLGQTRTVSSNTATVLTVETAFSPAPDATSFGHVGRNGHQNYLVNSTNVLPGLFSYGRRAWGMWRTAARTRLGGRVYFGDQTPGAWSPALRLPNGDDYAQSSRFLESGYYWGTLRARRRRRQDKRYAGEGQADGVALSDPRGFHHMYFDYRVKNVGGIGMAAISSMEAGSDEWGNDIEYTTAQSTLTAIPYTGVDYTTADSPVLHVGFFVLPSDGETEIARETKATNEIELRTYQRLEVAIDPRNWSVEVGSEENIFDLQTVLEPHPASAGGVLGTYGEQPQSRMYVGWTEDINERHIFLKSTESLRIVTDPMSTDYPVTIRETSGGDLVRSVPWAIAVVERHTPYDGGDVITTAARNWYQLQPSENLVSNPTFETDFSDWTEYLDNGTTAWSRDAAVFYDAAGSAKAIVSANGVAAVGLIAAVQSDPFPVTAGLQYGLSAAARTTHADLFPLASVVTYTNEAGTAGGVSMAVAPGASDDHTVNTWVPKSQILSAVPATAVSARIVLNVYSLNAASTGTVYFDRIALDTHTLSVSHAEETVDWGTITITPTWREGYYG